MVKKKKTIKVKDKFDIGKFALEYGLPLMAIAFLIGVELTVGNDSRKAKILLDRAKQMEEDGLFLEALVTYKYASILEPLSQEILSGLGRMYILEGELDAASEIAEELEILDKEKSDMLKYMIRNC